MKINSNKVKNVFFVLVFMSSLFVLPIYTESCRYRPEDDTPITTEYTPEYVIREQLNASIKTNAPRAIGSTGKIYVKDHYLMVVEPDAGLHIFDNINPENPQPLKFIEVPGIHDIAIKGDLFCVDNVVDMVFFKYGFDDQINLISRYKSFFAEPIPPDMESIPSNLNRPSGNHIIIRWVKK